MRQTALFLLLLLLLQDPGDDGEYPKPWLNASVILDAAELFAKAVAATPAGSKHRTRVDVAKLPTYFALLYLWEHAREFAAATGRAWPVEASAAAAFREFSRVFTGAITQQACAGIFCTHQTNSPHEF